MRKSRPLLALLAIGLIAADPGPGSSTAEVTAPALEVFTAPSDAAFTTGRVRRGDRLSIRGEADDGWVAIAPPAGSFSWIDAEAIGESGRGRARVVARTATVRPGAEGARMPGPPVATLQKGDPVQLIDRPPLVLRQGRTRRTLRAIQPPASEVRYVRATGLSRPQPASEPATQARIRKSARQAARVEESGIAVDRQIARVGPVVDESRLPPALAEELARLDAEHRAILRRPLDQWELGPFRRRYEELLQGNADPASQAALRARMDRLGLQEALARSASGFETVLRDSRARDRAIDALSERVRQAEDFSRRPFDAKGLLQVSSKQVDGEEVFALIGEDGQTSAYLKMPPGVPTDRLLTRRVGVRGSARFDEALRNRLIRVREIEPMAVSP